MTDVFETPNKSAAEQNSAGADNFFEAVFIREPFRYLTTNPELPFSLQAVNPKIQSLPL